MLVSGGSMGYNSGHRGRAGGGGEGGDAAC